MYPVVPGHEITGLITKVGSNVTNFKIGDKVGVGCLAATCLECEFCKDSQECDQIQLTYNGIFWDGSITYGGYSNMIVADHRFVVHMPENLPMDAAAPLLCAGITVFSPMKDNNLIDSSSSSKKIGIVGLGGLVHVAVKFGKAFGHHVTVISTSPSKEKEARERLGADDFIISTSIEQLQSRKRSLDFILDTMSAHHSLGPKLGLLKVNGTLESVTETQDMMDLCRKHNITCDIETVTPDKINEAFDRLAKNDVKYRFVIDVAGKSPDCLNDLPFERSRG
ncbi:hypothetical protein RJ639_005868 [Escallonia herrerae]|uniref:Alcohol dehydrogenase-like N-terminal domain-containing protein n=1 Tax=Escallonia herrerae TaxID=1293975 RepID=A0AA88W3S6_9ASTE|nr:hypothetical protein RJ639_005868 [Escallonia herrerae]